MEMWPPQDYKKFMVVTGKLLDVHGNYFLRSVLSFILKIYIFCEHCFDFENRIVIYFEKCVSNGDYI